MVLQRDIAAPIWGWTEPGALVTVRIQGRKASALAGEDGKWIAKIGPLKAGGPFDLEIEAAQPVVLRNVLVGDVWLASGQSNMEWRVSQSMNSAAEIAFADFPKIRHLTVRTTASEAPLENANTDGWLVCDPQTVGDFSAVAYFFGRELHRELDIPIGLINSSWGGTPMEAWTPMEALTSSPTYKEAPRRFEAFWKERKDQVAASDFEAKMAAWRKQTGGVDHHTDPGDDKFEKGWAEPDFKDGDWARMELPAFWEDMGLPELDGAVWFRRTVEVPADWAGKKLSLSLGAVDDFDTTHFNGTRVGGIGAETENAHTLHRRYEIPASLVKAGKNVVAVRVFDRFMKGGFAGTADQMSLTRADNIGTTISLAGSWNYKVSVPLIQKPSDPRAGAPKNVPSVLYQSMIHPLVPYGVKGVIWYQGESNAERWAEYLELSKLMIGSWRERFGNDFPFLLVQLAGYDVPGENWPRLRETQLQATQQIPKLGMAVAMDIGMPKDIHPKDKQEVGRRLGLAALAIAYNQKVEYSGPVYRSMGVFEGAAYINFDHVGGGLVAKDGILEGFEIAGPDRLFVPAKAEIIGDQVKVHSPEVKDPVAVRYAWKGWLENTPLQNKAGLPASPFRTDDFPQ
jgi:sialate O-acetylesterase